MKMTSNCPKCNHLSFPLWKKIFAVWPFDIRCRDCGVKVHLKIPMWLNILIQLFGLFAFWSILLIGISLELWNIAVGVIIGAIIAVLIALIPGFFVELEERKK
ncbi:MAG: hypothetical protein AB2563_10835 [Candidatus Thiodiazotropha endolucinida]